MYLCDADPPVRGPAGGPTHARPRGVAFWRVAVAQRRRDDAQKTARTLGEQPERAASRSLKGTAVTTPGIDPDRLALALAVLAEVDTLDPDHPDAVAVRRATAGVYKSVKVRRRSAARAARVSSKPPRPVLIIMAPGLQWASISAPSM